MTTNPRLNTTGAVRQRRGPVQKRAQEQDSSWGTKHVCTEHMIEYYIFTGERVRCPMCTQFRDDDELRAQLLQRENELKMATSQLQKLQVLVDIQTAIRQAIEILDDDDYAWLKLQMYQYKLDKSVALKATHGKPAGAKRVKRGDKLPPNGFMALPRKGDPEGHLATSIGGLAMAEYLDEAITCFGSAQAMGIMLKAWWKALPGGQS